MVIARKRGLPLLLISFLCLVAPGWTAETESQEIELQQLITGVEFARQHIRSGELRVSIITKTAAKMSQEAIEAWKTEKEQEIQKKLERATDEAGKASLESGLRMLSWQAQQFGPSLTLEESNVAFQVLDTTTCLYRLTSLQRSENEEYHQEGHLKYTGQQRILSYDGQLQALQLLYGGAVEVELHRGNRLYGYLGYHRFGRWRGKIPSDAKWIGKQTYETHVCDVVEFPDPQDERTIVKLWIDPNIEFCIRKSEYYGLPERRLFARGTSSAFRRFGDVLYPTSWTWVTYKADATPSMDLAVTVHDAHFDCDFPADFFDVDPASFGKHGWTLGKGSDPAAFSEVSRPQHVPDISEGQTTCGPESLLYVCRQLQVDASFDEIAKLCQFDEERGTTMLGLYQAAQAKGLQPQAIQIKKQDFSKIPTPAIAFLKPGHFLVINKVTSREALVYDPAHQYDSMSQEALLERWDGELLVFQREFGETSSVAQSATIAVDHAEVVFGPLPAGSQFEHVFVLSNPGQQSVKILEIQHPCACTTSLASGDEILPQAQLKIHASLRVPETNGVVRREIHLFTDDPGQPRITLAFRGRAYVPVMTVPEAVRFGFVKYDAIPRPTRDMTVHYAKEQEVQVTGIRFESAVLGLERLSPLDSNAIELSFAFQAGRLPIGPFAGTFWIDYLHDGQKGSLKRTVTGEVLGELKVTPSVLSLGVVRREQPVSRRITLSRLDSHAIRILGTEAASNQVQARLEPSLDETRQFITITTPADAVLGTLRDTLVIRTDSVVQPRIEVPIYGIVTE